MAYLKKNVNMFLLLLFVIIIGGVAGLTTFYQTTYKDLSLNYEDQVAEIEKLLTDLNAERAKLNQTALQLDVKEEREEQLSKEYTDVKQEKEAVAQDLTSTKETLQETSALLQQKQEELKKAAYDLKVTSEALANAQREANEFREKAASYKANYDRCQRQLSELQNPQP
ncbi:TPA: hypothetical protein HA249_06165 [Candidatus Woesearchaeota archaeon]|nr:hypothetical protein [Candidatus Woesearchaeota archaeon]HII88205.1 hypothetical protein [Candidatus Woesearchaeota archaeon]